MSGNAILFICKSTAIFLPFLSPTARFTNLVLLTGLAYGGAARLPTQIRIRYEPCSSHRPRKWWRCTPPHPDSD